MKRIERLKKMTAAIMLSAAMLVTSLTSSAADIDLSMLDDNGLSLMYNKLRRKLLVGSEISP